MEILAKRIRELRIEKGLSLLALSKVIHVSHSTILRWENGSVIPSAENLYNLAVYFGVSSDYLLGLEE